MSTRRRDERENQDRGLLPDRDSGVAWPFQEPDDEEEKPTSIRERSETDKALHDLGDDFAYRCHPDHPLNELRRKGLWERRR